MQPWERYQSEESKMKNIKSKFVKAIIVIVLFTVILSVFSKYHFRFDLTSEKRYTLSETTKQILEKNIDTIHFQIYLNGDLPISFYRLKNEINDLLEEFTEYSDENITFEFIDPADNEEKQLTNKTYEYLVSQGLIPYTIQEKDDAGKEVSRVVFPGAIVLSKNKVLPINFLKTSMLSNSDQNINSAIQNIEYELINAIRKISLKQKHYVGFLYGHDELDKNQTASIIKSLQEYYNVERFKIDSNSVSSINKYKAIIICKPIKAFSEVDKFIIDQYIMNGGHVAWLLDYVNVPEDSLRYQRMVLGLASELNLDDMLFRYGIRINYNVVLDNQCAIIPLNVAPQGTQPQFNPTPWYFHPLVNPATNNPITKNLNLVKLECPSVIDTVGDNQKNRKVTVLLRSSQYSKILATPVPVSFDILEQSPDARFFNKYDLPLGVLIEGTFSSVYKNRMLPKTLASTKVKETSKQTSMIVIADGDIVKNDVKKLAYDTMPMPLGYDRYTKETFGNKEFMLNAINYLCDDAGLLNIRSRELKIRLLNKERITSERTMWQVINIILPLLLLVIAGILIIVVRKRINGRK